MDLVGGHMPVSEPTLVVNGMGFSEASPYSPSLFQPSGMDFLRGKRPLVIRRSGEWILNRGQTPLP